ncbi:alpha/beta fold hydrolase [Loktanella sp. IMCC34160]|uniref:alpha/beta fold hydrolase n=1 Tax=Loktanella sp. IMCC34160 TaxID=2510646 RepID=UPI00101D6AF7|nr:alpha/beta fold hydrolase [Loktanella sp. IMCC34160]RYG90600.1 alpha/beta fold hydrolase [Loktanella sp. IMCC34160]
MSDFLLVHGSGHGAWCWDRVVPALERLGHSARAIDLPGAGDDPTPHDQVTLARYAQAVADAVKGGEVLVGHSAGGYAITAAAELVPDRIDRLIYLCAYVPVPGMTLADRRRSAPSQPLMDAVSVDAGRIAFTVDPAKAASKFYNDMDETLAAWAVSKLRPQPIAPQETVVDLRRSPALPRRYIRCMNDQTIPPEFQVTMTEDWPPDTVTEMPTSHSPFLSDPDGLAAILDRFARD